VASRRPNGFSKGDLLEKAAACDRALSIVNNPEHRQALRHLQALWKELAEESPAVLKAHFTTEILLLIQFQAEISAAALH
jgi:hypothetical protein